MTYKLLPCPFCGGEARMHSLEVDVRCSVCGAKTAPTISSVNNAPGAVAAWNRRAQPENEPCADCTGIVYRQTASGKIVPADKKCAVMEQPPCYQPDGDGCAYQIYGDHNDEPIDKCKSCPLCYADKVRHKKPENEPLTCKDCEHAAYEWSESNKNTETCHCKKWKRGMKQTDFCSYGIRKPERSEG